MKAHIANNQHAKEPTILAWALTPGDHGKLAGIAPALGARIIDVAPADTGKTIEQLLIGSGSAASRSAVQTAATPSILLVNFNSRDTDTLLDLLKQAKTNIPLKAAATPSNLKWTWNYLIAQLSAEHAAFAEAGK